MQQNASLLIAAAFAMIGFALGRVTAPTCGTSSSGSHAFILDMAHELEGDMPEEDVHMIIQSLDASGLASDTVLTIPGGTVKWVRNGDQVQVEVEMEDTTTAAGSPDRTVVVEKRVVISGSGD